MNSQRYSGNCYQLLIRTTAAFLLVTISIGCYFWDSNTANQFGKVNDFDVVNVAQPPVFGNLSWYRINYMHPNPGKMFQLGFKFGWEKTIKHNLLLIQGHLKKWTGLSALILPNSKPLEISLWKFQHFYNYQKYDFSQNLKGVA